MRSRLALPVAALLAAVPGTASAQVTATAAPDTVKSASHLRISIDGSAAPFSGRIPRALVLSLDRRFTVDMDAATVCSDSAAMNGGCPAASQIASGTAVVEASFAGAPGSDVNATLQAFRTQTVPAGAIASLVVVLEAQGQRGSARGEVRKVAGDLGYEVRFDELPAPPTPAGVTLKLKRLDIDIGAARDDSVTVTRSVKCKRSAKSRSCKKKRSCRRGRRCPRYRAVKKSTTVRRDLLRNPATCTGSWLSRAAAAFEDGTTQAIDAPIACQI